MGATPDRRRRECSAGLVLGAGFLVSACGGPQSALDPAGEEAAEIAHLFWVMLAGAGLVWALVVGAAVFGGRFQRQPISDRAGLRLILWSGAFAPTLILAGLLIYGLRLMPVLRAAEPALRIEISAEQYWWRITYVGAGDVRIETANELRLPAGRAAELTLDSVDVIHSLWIPSLGGKMDMIPGRTNRLVLRPQRPGTYRGVCAEFCGTAHALMAFPVEVMPPADFDAWLVRQAAPATPGGDEAAFLANGCGGCHTVRGTAATGTIGPDLTHLAGRSSLGAGLMPNTPGNRRRFVADVERLKPGVRMPSFGMLAPAELDAILAYMESLR
ncbi:cytochrome c oxidase subunit II [Ancylobacter oerskovii]|uniref:Cytochrome aa3 subunit 2 n=1 Tax=Ancylobacter oerskovii TaxID=459519 RepID=A0ABW4Z261_9HYPH|nr:cytochrome c oxidase subunit II [Ancylobacter oerskovii]MBS7544740.1 cytochrome c oxidase subunit II [Ancylobacter oerskovii]